MATVEGETAESPGHIAGGVLTISLTGKWITPLKLEAILDSAGLDAHPRDAESIAFEFGENAGLMAGAGLRLLSLLNQLAAAGYRVHLRFATREKLYSYLDRNRFFEHLDPRITSDPAIPQFSSAIYRGQAASLVEIARLDPSLPGDARTDAVTPLVEALVRFYANKERTRHLHNAVFATITELIDNVYNHSESALPGFAILQAYTARNSVQIAVSDSGIGIPESIRRGLQRRVSRQSDDQLIIDAFRSGLSRHGAKQGHACGLPNCARLAAEFGSTIEVRTPSAEVSLHPHTVGPGKHEARIHPRTHRLAGTHICLHFPLDTAA